MGIIQPTLLFSTTTFAHQHFLIQSFRPTPTPLQWPSSSLSSSPPWLLLPSLLPRAVPLTTTRRSRSTPRTARLPAVTARSSPAATAARTSLAPTASASPSSLSPSSRLAVPTSLLAALLAMPPATSSTLRPTALPSLFKRDKNTVRLPATFQHLQSRIMVFGVLGSSINLMSFLG